MWISQISLEDIRGFAGSQNVIECAKNINLVVGQNNSGKSTILNSIQILQEQRFQVSDITLNRTSGIIKIHYMEPGNYVNGVNYQSFVSGRNSVILSITAGGGMSLYIGSWQYPNNFGPFQMIPQKEPNNLIYPYLSKRKVSNFSEDVSLQFSSSVTGNLQNLYAKIDRLSNPYFQPAHEEYKAACESILNFPISTISSESGKRAAYIVRNMQHIPLTSMGEGVSNLLGLIVDLCIAENKIFLIEEPENDIHPKALKALLELIEKKSENNQFFISTHSNIVTKYLGSVENSKVFKVSMSFDETSRLPISKVAEVPNEETARRELLEELGYEFQDYDLHKAWLFLEESSAEVVIRDFLIPQFAKKLAGKLKTFSANGVDKVKPKFEDFNKLFVFLNLQPIYKNRVWVVIDDGDNEKKIIDDMKEMYSKKGWNADNFMQFTERCFEKYYPQTFSEKVENVLAIIDKQDKREKKKDLIEELKQWWKDNPEQSKTEFAESAKEVIAVLKLIEKQIL